MNLTMGRNNLTKLNEKASCICGKANQRGALQVFFQINFPKYLNIRSKDHVIKPYRTHQCWYFLTLTEKSASARKYRCSTSPRSVQGIVFSTGNGCVTIF